MNARKKPVGEIQLTKLESDVIAAIWDSPSDAMCVRDVMKAVNRKKRKKLAYTTVQTVLNILVGKGALASAKAGRALEYSAKVPREQVSRTMVNDFVQRLFGGKVTPLLHQIVDDSDLNVDELKDLRKWINAKLRNAEDE